MDDLRKSLEVECSKYAYDYGDYFNVGIYCAASLESLIKWFVNDVDVVYDLLRDPISGIFTFYEL